jgi:DNA-binding NarL/FixJ family response regulator
MPTVFAIHAEASTHLLVKRAVDVVPHAELTGSTTSAVEAARVIGTLSPDAVTVDVRLPDGDGLALAERLRTDHPLLRLIVFGPSHDRLLLRAVTAGISAYVPDTAGLAQIAAAIRSSLAGQASFSSRSLTGALRNDRSVTLSPREQEVIALIRDGLGPGQIASRLQVSESTVKTYVARVRAKVGMDSAALRRNYPHGFNPPTVG